MLSRVEIAILSLTLLLLLQTFGGKQIGLDKATLKVIFTIDIVVPVDKLVAFLQYPLTNEAFEAVQVKVNHFGRLIGTIARLRRLWLWLILLACYSHNELVGAD